MSSVLYRSLRLYQVYGANTNVGKTVFSTVLSRALVKNFAKEATWYVKPVSTGPDDEADDLHIRRFAPGVRTKCLFKFDEPVSPHIAAASKTPPSDSAVIQAIEDYVKQCSQENVTFLLETAGGVHSPTPSGSSQADCYRSLRLPIWLVADPRLGGISSTISAFESLHIRGYDIDAVMVFEDNKYQNFDYLSKCFGKKDIAVLHIPAPPTKSKGPEEDFEWMSRYYESMSRLDKVEELIKLSRERHHARIDRLESMSTKAYQHIWYPFTQHQELSPKSILTIDSAKGDFFQTLRTRDERKGEPLMLSSFDGSASWWTQGLGHGSPDLSLTAAYAAGRYGHIMFAGAIHEPALSLAELLLRHTGNPRLQKVFYSDNGSTGIEVATKMALASSCKRYKWQVSGGEVHVLGLDGSYHGDTVAAMDLSQPSTYNEKVHWYQGRGYWFLFPSVKMKDGDWVVETPRGYEEVFGVSVKFDTLEEIFNMKDRDRSEKCELYESYIQKELERLVISEGKTFGALIMEPVILGAGGMILVDPLFQRCLVRVVRRNAALFVNSPTNMVDPTPEGDLAWSGLPVIFDEVFTGLYRLGRFSSSSFLQVFPDISVHAKLLTGGLLPLCTTLASDSIYDTFISDEKADALLHGHSYTAHAVGCEVAKTSVETMLKMEVSGTWDEYKKDWQDKPDVTETSSTIWSVWSRDFVTKISMSDSVESVVALGSVLAIRLHDSENPGYSSTAASGLQTQLQDGVGDFNIHSRVLGDVLYLMASQISTAETLGAIELKLLRSLM